MKRKLITLSRVIKTGSLNFVRNAWLAIAAMAVMVITLTVILFSVIANATFANTIAQITDKIDVSAFLKDGASQQDINKLIAVVKQQPNVREVRFVSKEEALKKYKQQNANNPQLLSAVSQTENPLPATIQIKPRDLNHVQEIKDGLAKVDTQQLVADISYKKERKEAIDNISYATNILQRAGVITVLVFAVISVLIIFNTIQMAIFNRRDELTIMRLLGASTWYIRGPFVVESIIYGILSAGLSTLLIHLLFAVSSNALQASSLGLLDISYAAEYFRAHLFTLLAAQLGIGILIGAASSIVATRRYLKFKTTK